MIMLLDEIAAEEGCVDHLYLDTKGNTTCGVGMLVAKSGELGRFTWSDFTQALKDYRLLEQMRRDSSYGLKWAASRFKPLVRARMLNPREGADELIESLDKQLRKSIPGFEDHPVAVQSALIDMAWNLGVNGLVKGYPSMLRFLSMHNYLEAAAESHRKGISDGRNQRTYDRIASGNTSLGSRPGRGG